ncbi:MAG TPA: hypothetical protein VL359_18790, partial [bacterium]|nr:hypothetical protein [bacterium]
MELLLRLGLTLWLLRSHGWTLALRLALELPLRRLLTLGLLRSHGRTLALRLALELLLRLLLTLGLLRSHGGWLLWLDLLRRPHHPLRLGLLALRLLRLLRPHRRTLALRLRLHGLPGPHGVDHHRRGLAYRGCLRRRGL